MQDEQLTQRLAETLDWIGQRANSAESFVLAEAPELAREVVAAQIWDGWVTVGVCAIVIVAGLAAWMAACVFAPKVAEDYETEGVRACCIVIGGLIFMLVAGVSFGFGVSSLRDITEAHVAPRVVIVDYVSDKLK